jgi:hypothetical protein
MADRRAKTSPKNSAKSTGPITLAGKQISSVNARTHDILSQELLLPNENPAEFSQLLDELIADLKPSGTMEFTLVERIAMTLWRQRRLARAERADILRNQHLELLDKIPLTPLTPLTPPMEDMVRMAIRANQNYADIEELLAELRVLSITPGIASMTVNEFSKAYPLTGKRLIETLDFSCPEDWVEAHQGTLGDLLRDVRDWIYAQYAELMTQIPKALEQEVNILPKDMEKFSRYQSSLDNALYKAMRALRQAQA